MSAVDESGYTAFRFRETPRRRFSIDIAGNVEIGISPDQPVSVEICCLMGVSVSFIWSYFNLHYPH